MSYTPTTWQTGDVITATKLNNIEQGIVNASGGPLIVHITLAQDEFNKMLDKTWSEIRTAILSNGVTIVEVSEEGSESFITVSSIDNIDHSTEMGYIVISSSIEYYATTADGYPQTNWEP